MRMHSLDFTACVGEQVLETCLSHPKCDVQTLYTSPRQIIVSGSIPFRLKNFLTVLSEHPYILPA